MNLQNFLEQAGLDRHETAVYLALVNAREATAGQLAKKTGVPRTYTYAVLRSLEEKGFVQALKGTRGIQRYGVTDFEAPRRYLERQQLDLYRVQQEAKALSAQLEQLAHPEVSLALTGELQDEKGWEDFWRLLHSTITREIWVMGPPEWWGDVEYAPEIKKWEQYRLKQHIWERRWTGTALDKPKSPPPFTEFFPLPSPPIAHGTLILLDQYQVQITSWKPFRALRIESAEMVGVLKGLFPSAA